MIYCLSRWFQLALVVLLGVPALPLVSAAPDAKPARKARFLALGDAPPFRQEIRDGVRYELDPPPGSVPPPELAVTAAAADGEDPAAGEADPPKPVPLQLRLGRLSDAIEVPGGAGQLRLAAPGAGPAWLTLPRPESGDFLVLLWRKPGAASWDEVLHRIVPDGPLGAPGGNFRLINLFPQSVYLRWGAESLQVKPSMLLTRAIAPGAEVPFEVLVADAGGRPKRYHRTSVSLGGGERGWVLLFRADGESPRRPLKVAVLREAVAARPLPVPAAGQGEGDGTAGEGTGGGPAGTAR